MLRTSHLVAAAVLFAAAAHAQKELIMPRMQRNTYLSHARPAEEFGLRTIRGKDGLSYTGAARIEPGYKVTAAFESGPIPLIRIKDDGQQMNALLDAGSPVSWLEFGRSRDFNAVFLGTEKKHMPYTGPLNTGGAPGYAAVVPRMNIGYVPLYNTPLYVRMAIHSLGPFARGIEAPHVDAVFGYDLLQHFEYVRFDFRKREVLFSSSDIYVPDVDLLKSIAAVTTSPEGGLAVEGSLNGEPTPVILDTAGDYFFSRGDAKVKMTRQVRIGDAVWSRLPTLLLPTGENRTPRAGLRMLENYIVTVCPKRGVVYFETLPE